jgi:hypothetical protein
MLHFLIDLREAKLRFGLAFAQYKIYELSFGDCALTAIGLNVNNYEPKMTTSKNAQSFPVGLIPQDFKD